MFRFKRIARNLLHAIVGAILGFACVIAISAIAKADQPIMLDFYSDWCQPCQTMSPIVDSLVAEGYSVRRVNIESQPDLAEKFQINALPCFVFVDGTSYREYTRITGKTTAEKLRSRFSKPSTKNVSQPVAQPRAAWRYEQPTGYRASVVRVYCDDGGDSGSKGSGVLVLWNDRPVILTARHVIEDARSIIIKTCRGQHVTARILKYDPVWDCAVLATDESLDITPAEMSFGDEAMPKKGERLESCGYGPDGRLACNSGLFLGYAQPARSTGTASDWLAISGNARGGDSGGPIFKNGRVVGVLWGSAGDRVLGVQAGRVHLVLNAAVPVTQLSDCCPSGMCASSGRVPTPAQSGDSLLPWRRGVEDQLAKISGQLGSASRPPVVNFIPTPPTVEQKKPGLLKNPKPERKGLFRRFYASANEQCDGFDVVGVLALVALGVAVYSVVKRGGVHTIVEGKRSQIEQDAAGNDLKAKLAGRLLAVHDGDIGARLASIEAKLGDKAEQTVTPVAK